MFYQSDTVYNYYFFLHRIGDILIGARLRDSKTPLIENKCFLCGCFINRYDQLNYAAMIMLV